MMVSLIFQERMIFRSRGIVHVATWGNGDGQIVAEWLILVLSRGQQWKDGVL
jgi:hypothetical protein